MKKLASLTNKKGFTLIELIIVIAILGIIALIAIPNLAGIRQRSQVSADKRTAEQIGKAVRIWATDTDAAEGRIIPANGTVLQYDELNADKTNKNFLGLTPDYISVGYTAESHSSGAGLYYISSVGTGVNNADQKIAVGIGTAPEDFTSISIATKADVKYTGGAAGWAYLEQ